MKIVADESVDKQIVDKLRTQGHDVLYVAELAPGIDDEAVLLRGRESNALLLTADKDFGDLVFRQRLLHSGVLLIRLAGLTPDEKASTVAAVFELHGEAMRERFAVLSKRSLRLRDMPKMSTG